VSYLPTCRHTHLPLVHVGSEGPSRGCCFDISTRQNNYCIIPAEFQMDSLEVPPAGLPYVPSSWCRPCKGNDAYLWRLGQRDTGFNVPRKDLQNSSWETSFFKSTHNHVSTGDRCPRIRFQDHTIT